MAFPIVETTNTTNGTGASASPVVNLPTGIVSGDLLIVLFRTAIGTAGVGWPTGWTELVESTADASDDAIAIGYRLADGTEGATITLTTSSAKFAAVAYRISGAEEPATQAPQNSAAVTGTSATPDPGSLSPTGGAKDYLWLWMGGWEAEQTSPPAGNPTNYTNPIGANSGTAGVIATNCRVASAIRSLNAVTEDPGSWTISASDDWTAFTVAVHPSSVPTISTATMADADRNWDTPSQDIALTFNEAVDITPAPSVGSTVAGLTVQVNAGTESALTYVSGNATANWKVRRAELIQQNDSVVMDYVRATGELLAVATNTELANTTNKAVTNSLTKRIRFTLKKSDNSVVASETVKYSINEYDGGVPSNADWMARSAKGTTTTAANGLFDVEYTGATAVGQNIYAIVIRPDTTPTQSFVWNDAVQ